MSGFRRLTIGALATVAVVAFVPAGASATSDGSLQGLVLSGECPGRTGLKDVIVAPGTPNLFAPLRLMDQDFDPTGTWLFPYTVAITGEGLKTRHLGSGETYARPGKPPGAQVICTFEGATKEDGPFQVQISGPLRGR